MTTIRFILIDLAIFHGMDYNASASVASSGGFSRRLPPGRESAICLVGFLLCMLAFFIVGFAANVTAIYAALTIYAFPSAVVVPCLTALASKYGKTGLNGLISPFLNLFY